MGQIFKGETIVPERMIFMRRGKKGAAAVCTAAVLLCTGMLPAIPATAAETVYLPGDVDMDEVVTGHDAAMVTRYLYVDPHLLTDQQKQLADVNGDGVIDQSDADQIYASQVYELGNWRKEKPFYAIDTRLTSCQMQLCSWVYAGNTVEFGGRAWNAETGQGFLFQKIQETGRISELDYHLMDLDADGDVDAIDALISLYVSALEGAGLMPDGLLAEKRYDYDPALLKNIGHFYIYPDFVNLFS